MTRDEARALQREYRKRRIREEVARIAEHGGGMTLGMTRRKYLYETAVMAAFLAGGGR
jgi:hypothetical protein